MIMSIIALRYKNYLELIPWEEEITGNVAETATCLCAKTLKEKDGLLSFY